MTGAPHSGAPADLDLRFHDWRALIEQLPLAVYIDRLDEWSSNLNTSPQVEGMLGYSPEEWTSDDHLLLRIMHPDDRDRVMAAHRRSCETGEPFRMEYRMIARDGRVRWFLDYATVVPAGSGRAGFHHGFLLDITERKALEAELAERTEQLERRKGYFESLLEISPVVIVTTDVDDVVTSWNPAAERRFGHARTEALGRKIDDLVVGTAEMRVEAARLSHDALANGRAHAVTRRMHKDGSLIDVEVLAAPVLDPKVFERLGAGSEDREFTAELVGAFLREAPALLEALRGADVRRAAHTLRSNARVFGATRLAELCQELEALAKADRLADAAGLLGRIDAEFARVERALGEPT